MDPVNSLVNGELTMEQWIEDIKAASAQMLANIQS